MKHERRVKRALRSSGFWSVVVGEGTSFWIDAPSLGREVGTRFDIQLRAGLARSRCRN
jgi:hypothetical protein